MIWLTWRQFRVQALTAAAALAAFAILLAVTGPHLVSLYAASTIPGCHGGSCGTAASDFLSRLAATSTYPIVYLLGIGLILGAPAVIGIFWGAPLIARELETRTFTLTWNQSITRTRWLVVKLVMTGLAAMAVTEALSLIYGWWADPISKAIGLLGLSDGSSHPFEGRFSSVIFATHGITPLGYAAFAFALGTAAGALIRRTVPAMAVTLAVFAAAQVAMPLGVRPHLIPPDRTIASIASAGLDFGNLTATVVPGQPGAWMISSEAINPAGQPVSTLPAACAGSYGTKAPDPGQCMESRATGRPSPTSPPAATGPSSGSRPGSSWPSRSPWPGSVSGGSAAGGPDVPGEG
jgi:hypothetical protein